jgi:hypothetical protein
MPRPHTIAAAVVCVSVGLATAAAQSANDINVRNYEKKRKEELIATGQRHVDLGWGLRNKGLIQQTTYQLVLAVELSEGQHRGASMVLNIVRNYGDAFWKKKRKKPRKGALKAYEKKAQKLVEADMSGQIKLARYAHKARLDERVREHLVQAMRFGAEVTMPKDPSRSGAKIEGFAIDDELAKWLLEQTVAVNGGERRFEPAGRSAPRLEGLHEVADQRLVVRADLDAKVCEGLHAMGLQLFEALLERLDGAPTRPLQLVVFAKRADYDAYLKACGRADVASKGYCDYGTFQALVCAEGLDSGSVNALVLHELTHLYFFGATPVAMPDWYMEGLAETFGGQGTFAWNGRQLTVGGLLRSDRLDGIQSDAMTLEQVLAGNAINLMRQDHGRAMRFYAMSWALQRWLTTGDHAWRQRFDDWEAKTRGTLDGSSSTRSFGSPQRAQESFLAEFRKDLPAMDKAFQIWLMRL